MNSFQDLAMMHLSLGQDNFDELGAFNIEEFELLFEAYLQDAQGICRTISQLDAEIENTEALVEIQLDTARNRLLTFGFVLNLITCVAGMATLVAGLFGMVSRLPPPPSRQCRVW